MSSSAFTALALRITGFVLILVTLLNLILGLVPLNFGDVQWQLGASSQIIDQSLMPLVGIVLLTASFWVDHVSQRSGPDRAIARLMTFGFAAFMGLILVLTVPLQINSVRVLHDKAVSTMDQSFSENQPQFKKTVDDAVERQRQMIQVLMQDPQRLQEAIKSGQVNQEQLRLLDQFRADPKNLDTFLQSERKNIEKQLKEQVEGRKQAETDKLKEGWKTLFRACVTSIALAIAYLLISWQGFRQLKQNE